MQGIYFFNFASFGPLSLVDETFCKKMLSFHKWFQPNSFGEIRYATNERAFNTFSKSFESFDRVVISVNFKVF